MEGIVGADALREAATKEFGQLLDLIRAAVRSRAATIRPSDYVYIVAV